MADDSDISDYIPESSDSSDISDISSDSDEEVNPVNANARDHRHIRYTDKQREWIFFSICQARAQIINGPPTDEIGRQVIERAQSILGRMRAHHGLIDKPSIKAIRAIWKKFWNPVGRIDVGPRRRKKIPIGLIAIIDSILEYHPGISHRQIHQYLPEKEGRPDKKIVSESTVFRTMKLKMHLFFYRKRKCQVLTQEHINGRWQFALTLRTLLQNISAFRLDYLIVSDEMMVGVNRHYNSQNDGQWFKKGQQDRISQLVTRKSFDNQVHVWVGLNYHVGIIGPFFIDEIDVEGMTDKEKGRGKNSLTGTKYAKMIVDSVMPAIYSKVKPDLIQRSFWWQQDGAGVHCSPVPLRLLGSIFGDRVLSRKTPRPWPAQSPDLNPLDYSFWSLLRKKISEVSPKNVREIKRAAIEGCMLLEDTVQRIIADFPVRIRACIDAEGNHFDPWLREYKRRVFKHKICPQCAVTTDNDLLCDACNLVVMQNVQLDIRRNAQEDERQQRDFADDEDDEDDLFELID